MSRIAKLTDLEELERAIQGSHRRPVWFFKHSLICPISSRAWAEFQRFVEEGAGETTTDFAVIEIQRARPVSAALAEKTGVRHESPQAILVIDGSPVWHASHSAISSAALAAASGA